jgi:hypothetical protein
MLFRESQAPIRADLVSFPDGIELEVYVGGNLRKRLRFLRDAGARAHAENLRARLEARGYAVRAEADGQS